MPTQADLILNQELAAWVQAVGSVIAIFVAISVPLYLNHLSNKQEKNLQNVQKQKYFVTLLPTLYRIRHYSQDFLKQMQQHQLSSEHLMHTLETEYLELIPVFAKELHIFVHSQIYDNSLNQLAFELFHSEEILRQHLSAEATDQMQIQSNMLQHSLQVNRLSEVLIQRIEHSYAQD